MLLNLVIQTLTQSKQSSHLSLKIRQRITYLENKNKILNKPQNGKNSYYSTDDSVVIPDDSASPDNPQSIPLFYPETPKPYKRTGYSNSRPKRKTNCGIKSKKYHFTLRF